MKKQLKAALAIGAAGAILIGGSGTLATWTNNGTVSNSTITSGVLTLGPCVDGTWYSQIYVNSPVNPNPQVFIPNISTYRLRPGFNYTYYCDSLVKVTGGRIKANVTVDKSKLTGGLTTSSLALRTYALDQSGNVLYDSSAPVPNTGTVTQTLNNTNLTVQVLFTIAPDDSASAGATLSTQNLTIDIQQLPLTAVP